MLLSLLAAAAIQTSPMPTALDTRWTFGAHEPFTMYRRMRRRSTGAIDGNALWTQEWLDWFDAHAPEKMQEMGFNYFRWMPCLTCRAWEDYFKRMCTIALTEGEFDGIMFDNVFDIPCHCKRCEGEFRKWMKRVPYGYLISYPDRPLEVPLGKNPDKVALKDGATLPAEYALIVLTNGK